MSPEIKFHAFITSTTTLITFSLWSFMLQQVSTHPVTSVLVAGVFSLGIYRLINTIFLTIFRNVQCVKKFILGASYMEGTWVGFFVGHDNNIRYLVETFEQDLSLLKVRGKVYRNDFSYHASHVSTDATIDILNGRLSYSYDADAINNTYVNAGLARFELTRSSREKPAHHMVGYSSDLFNSKKLMAFEDKFSESTAVDLSKALEEAEKVHNKYRCICGVQTQ
jgi:hypothetical protein